MRRGARKIRLKNLDKNAKKNIDIVCSVVEQSIYLMYVLLIALTVTICVMYVVGYFSTTRDLLFVIGKTTFIVVATVVMRIALLKIHRIQSEIK